jgi:predicted  nucleic acid-binding Zn-ribbon protein
VRQRLLDLYEVQKIDSQVFEIQERRKTITLRLQELEEQGQGALRKIEGLESQLISLEKQARGQENTALAEKVKIKKWEARLQEIRNQREALALSREVDGAKRSVEKAEEETLSIWKQKEEMELEIETLRDEHTDLGVGAADEADKVKQAIVDAEAETARHAARREALVKEIPSNVVRTYDMVRSKRRGMGVAIVSSGSCQGCYVKLRPQLYNMLQHADSIEQCPQCQRFMVWEGVIPQAVETESTAEATV